MVNNSAKLNHKSKSRFIHLNFFKSRHLLLLLICSVLLSHNQQVYAVDAIKAQNQPEKIEEYVPPANKFVKTPVDKLEARIRFRSEGDKIPSYSYSQCVIGNCPKTAPPQIKELPEEKPVVKTVKEIELEPEKTPDYVETGEFKISAKKANKKGLDYDYKNVETSTSIVRINDKLSYDFEIVLWPNGIVSVPIQTLADLVDVPVTINHVDKSVSFLKPDTGEQVNIDYKNNKVMVGNNLIEVKSPKMLYIKEGFIVMDDIFIPAELAQYLLDIKADFLTERYTLNVETGRVLKAIVQLDEQAQEKPQFIQEEPSISVERSEKENKLLKVKQLNYSFGSTFNQSSSDGSSSSNKSATAGIATTGNFLGGKYNIGTSSYLGEQGLQIGNYVASLDYLGPKHELSLGSTYARLSDLAVSGSSLLGMRVGTLGSVNSSSVLPRLITGNADDNTNVELFINDVYTEKQKVEKGHFEFESVDYPNTSFVKVRVEQVNLDKTRKVVYDREFSRDKDILAPGQKEYLAFSGIDSSIMNSSYTLFGDKNRSSSRQPIRFSSGAKYRMGLTETLTGGVNFAHSFNLQKPTSFISGVTGGPRITRQSQSTSGYIGSMDLNYLPFKNMRIATETGISIADSLSKFEPNKTDFGSFLSLDYNKSNYQIFTKAFSYGSNFYSGGYGDTMDKRGGEISGNWNAGPINLSGNLMRYNSNLDKAFLGGLSTITNYGVYASGNIDKNSSLRAGVRTSMARNALQSTGQTDLDLAINRRFGQKVNLGLNYIHTISNNEDFTARNEQTDRTNRLNADLSVDANKLGVLRFFHEISMLDPEQKINSNYTSDPPVSKNLNVKLDRSRYPIKGFTFSPSFGYRYSGLNKGMLMGMDLGYVLKGGKQLVLSYAYNADFAKYTSGEYSSGARAQAISLNFVDTVNFGLSGLDQKAGNQSAFNPENGIIKGVVFLDLNQNGVKDPGEEGVEEIEVAVKNTYKVTTDKKGNYVAPNLSNNTYTVSIDKDTLPAIYTSTTGDVAVMVKRERVYVANLGVIVTPGSVTGKVEADVDNANNNEVIVLLLDKDGKEVKYTTTDSTGQYYIGSIPPGEYTVVVDKNYLDYNGLQMSEKEGDKITIPLVLDDFVDLEGINFKLVEKRAEVKGF